MSKIGLVLILILVAGRNYAQQGDFVLIQADNNQPFYVKMGDKAISSSAGGHLILSQLEEKTHTVIIGFPAKLFPERQYSIPVKKDMELQLKNLGERGWALSNPQTLELILPDKKEETAGSGIEGIKKDDAFSRLMAGLVSDTAVMYNTYAMEKALKDSPVAAAAPVSMPAVTPDTAVKVMADTTVGAGMQAGNPIVPAADSTGRSAAAVGDTLKSQTAAAHAVVTDTPVVPGLVVPPVGMADSAAAAAEPLKDSLHSEPVLVAGGSSGGSSSGGTRKGVVLKLSEKKTVKNWRGVYTDHTEGKKADTIVVIIPVDSSVKITRPAGEKMASGAQQRADSPDVQTITPLYRKSGGMIDRSGIDSMAASGTQGAVKTEPVKGEAGRSDVGKAAPAETKKGSKLVVTNSDCKNYGTDYDVDKLRVKMLEAGKDDDRIAVARKVFKTKCFTTRQIRALSEVFTTDAVKYHFFETAYPFVSDEHFGELAGLLADPVYNSKFKAMTGQQ